MHRGGPWDTTTVTTLGYNTILIYQTFWVNLYEFVDLNTTTLCYQDQDLDYCLQPVQGGPKNHLEVGAQITPLIEVK